MRKEREFGENVWYFIRTAVNGRAPVFCPEYLTWLFKRILSELIGLYPIKIRGLRCRFTSGRSHGDPFGKAATRFVRVREYAQWDWRRPIRHAKH
jgi:hypothetical protein